PISHDFALAEDRLRVRIAADDLAAAHLSLDLEGRVGAETQAHVAAARVRAHAPEARPARLQLHGPGARVGVDLVRFARGHADVPRAGVDPDVSCGGAAHLDVARAGIAAQVLAAEPRHLAAAAARVAAELPFDGLR